MTNGPVERDRRAATYGLEDRTAREIVMSFWNLLDRSAPILDEDDAAVACPDSALAIVDDALSMFACRTLVTGTEVVDRLLDLRNALDAAMLLRAFQVHDGARRSRVEQ